MGDGCQGMGGRGRSECGAAGSDPRRSSPPSSPETSHLPPVTPARQGASAGLTTAPRSTLSYEASVIASVFRLSSASDSNGRPYRTPAAKSPMQLLKAPCPIGPAPPMLLPPYRSSTVVPVVVT